MRPITWGVWLLTGLAAAWILASPPVLPAAPSTNAPVLPRGWGRLLASGTLLAVGQPAGTVALAISGPARLEVFEGGTAWRSMPVSGTHAVHLLPATLLIDADARPLLPGVVRAGFPAVLWAVVRPDAAILALTLQITSPRPHPRPAPRADEPAGASGVVIRRSGSTLTLLTASGARRSVVLTAATTVQHGTDPGALGPYDVLRVEGPVNSDGSLAATRITVEFASAPSAQVSGPVEMNAGGVGGLVVGGALVCTTAETYIVEREARGALAQLTRGVPVAVYGTPMMAGSTPVGLEAHVIVVR